MVIYSEHFYFKLFCQYKTDTSTAMRETGVNKLDTMLAEDQV